MTLWSRQVIMTRGLTTAYVCFFDSQCVYVISVALRLPAAYRSDTGSDKGIREGGRFEGLGGAKDMGRMSLGGKKL